MRRPRPDGGTPLRRRRGGGSDARLAQLLASRICHDLSGPIGIAADARDLVGADGGDPEGVTLVAESGALAAARLAFFRAAFGNGGDDGPALPLAEAVRLAERALASPRRRLRLADPDAAGTRLAPPLARLLLCLTLIAAEALPRGGLISVAVGRSAGSMILSLVAEGPNARLADEVRAAFAAADCRALTGRTVVGFYARGIADAVGHRITLDCGADRVRLTAAPALAGGQPGRA